MEKIVVIDGDCVLCSRFASVLRRIDRKQLLQIVAAGSPSGIQLLSSLGLTGATSVVFLDNGRPYLSSDAVIRLLAALRGPWTIFRAFLLLPRSYRDRLYFRLARNRYKWFGRISHCEVERKES